MELQKEKVNEYIVMCGLGDSRIMRRLQDFIVLGDFWKCKIIIIIVIGFVVLVCTRMIRKYRVYVF